MQKKGVNSGLFLPWTDFQLSTFFLCADPGEKKMMQVCVDVPMRQD